MEPLGKGMGFRVQCLEAQGSAGGKPYLSCPTSVPDLYTLPVCYGSRFREETIEDKLGRVLAILFKGIGHNVLGFRV